MPWAAASLRFAGRRLRAAFCCSAIASGDRLRTARIASIGLIAPRVAPSAATRPLFARSVCRSIGGNMKSLNASAARRIQQARFRCAAVCAMA
ncbi:hypothetical protein IEQ11_25455 [Lysobacter capsici]|uniref:hypothetical protein n=1 Tax=Lysobacter capsici TaxID=435897 RepID=UPI0017846764|nr:hypothetical protein [Lysobacter capsici]UOF15014.1 hypothetical protein IEQ11_25455 [Lysobacter capsici]